MHADAAVAEVAGAGHINTDEVAEHLIVMALFGDQHAVVLVAGDQVG